MTHQAAASTPNSVHLPWWRTLLASLALVLAALSFTAYLAARWTERQVLNPDAWAAYSATLPKNAEVSGALATTLTQQLFTGVPLEQKIGDALPPRAAFLAGPLADQLQARATSLTQRVIQSDSFTGVWTAANRLAVERLVTNARRGKGAIGATAERFSIDLASAKPLLQDKLGSESNLSPALAAKSQQAIAVATDLQLKRERLWQAIRTVDLLYAVLPVVFAVSLLTMLVLSSHRSRYMLSLALSSLGLLLVSLIAIRYGRSLVLQQVQVAGNLPAVTFIYDSLLSSLRAMIGWGALLWVVVLVVTLLLGPYAWAIRLRERLHVQVRTPEWWEETREVLGRYRAAGWLIIFGIVLIYLAFGGSLSGVELISALLVGLAAGLLMQLLSQKPLHH